jgi:hypothetical protein
MVSMPVANEDEVSLDIVDIDGSGQLVMRDKRVKQQFFPVYLNVEAGMSIISELHETPDFVRMANLIVRHHFGEQYINNGCYKP